MNLKELFTGAMLYLWGIVLCSAQSMVPNGNFEIYSACPNGLGQINNATGWANVGLGSIDYYNSCSGSSVVSVPNNLFGTELARSGNGYVGGYMFFSYSSAAVQEYLQIRLADTLEANKHYQVSFYYSLAEKSRYAISGIGIYFSPTLVTGSSSSLSVNPQLVCSDTLLINTGWGFVQFDYVASGNEVYMVIGNFHNNATTTNILAYPAAASNYTYMYFDSVSVWRACAQVQGQTICAGDSAYLHATIDSGHVINGWAKASNPGTLLSTDSGVTVRPIVTTDYLLYTSCDTFPVKVKVNPRPAISLGSDTVICPQRSLQLKTSPVSFVSYKWQDNSTQPTYTATDTGLYWAKVFNGICYNSDTIHIGPDTPHFKINLGADTAICKGSSLTLSTGYTLPYYHNWSTGAALSSIQVSTPGIYSVRVLDGRCYNYDTIKVSVDSIRFSVDLGPDTFVCAGETKLLDAGFADATYRWQDSSTNKTFAASQTGKYKVEVTRAGYACKVSDSVNIIRVLRPVLDIGPDTSICPGKSITLDVVNNFYDSILWNTNATTKAITTTDSGTYSVKVFDGSCYNSDTIHVAKYPDFNFSIGPDTAICKGTPFTLNTNLASPYTFKWNNNQSAAFIPITQTGTYWVRVHDGNCYQYDTAKVSIDTVMFKVDLGADQSLCNGDVKLLDAGYPGSVYQWQDNSSNQTYTAIQSGLYKVKVRRNGFTCPVSDSIQLIYFPHPNINLGADKILCKDSNLTIDLRNKGYEKVLWQDGGKDSLYNIATAGVYIASVFTNNCSSSDTILITTPQPQPLGLSTIYTICKDVPLDIDLRNKLPKLTWNDGDTSRYRSFVNPGHYTLYYTDNTCHFADSFDRVDAFIPVYDLPDDTIVCDLDHLILDPKPTNANTFLWQDGSTSNKYEPKKFGLYSVTITNNCGSKTDSTEVLDCSCDMYVPTAFTPTKDNLNETFRPAGCQPLYYRMIIFNRWGQRVFETEDFSQGWDGTFKGEPATDNIYVWTVEYSKSLRASAINKLLRGTVTLLK